MNELYCQVYLEQLQGIALKNKYTVWYFALCKKAALRAQSRKEAKKLLGYTEAHHVLPQSFKLGGNKDPNNLVYFSAREHYIVHLLLPEMLEGRFRKMMVDAFVIMSGRKVYRCNSWVYAKYREEFSATLKQRQTGVPCHSDAWKQELSDRWSGEKNPCYGKQATVLDANKGRIWIHKGESHKMIFPKELSNYPDWVLGRVNVHTKAGRIRHGAKIVGRAMVVFKGQKKKIHPESIQGYLNMGWELLSQAVSRNCPKCGRTIHYTTVHSCRFATARNSTCKRCSRQKQLASAAND